MARTLPASFTTELVKEVTRPVTVYEIDLGGGTVLRYSSQALTWGGNAYTALAVTSTPIIEEMGRRVPEITVRFSNVTFALRQYLTPNDQLSGKRLTVRRLLRNDAGALLTDSLIRFVGTIEQPRRVDDEIVELSVIGLLHGAAYPVPRRKLSTWCNAIFADGVDCNYTQSTTATNVGMSSQILNVADGTNLDDGEEITIGAGAKVAIQSGGGTGTITLADARSWSTDDPVRLVNCNREFSDCQKRERTHEYLGFRGVDDHLRIRLQLVAELWGSSHWVDRLVRTNLLGRADAAIPVELANFQSNIPILYGRRVVAGLEFERTTKTAPLTGSQANIDAQMVVICEGEIETLVAWRLDGIVEQDVVRLGRKTLGVYYRRGTIGIDDTEGVPEYEADPTTRERPQNRDYFSVTQDPISRTVYATQVQKYGPELPQDSGTTIAPLDNATFDIKGSKIGRYTTGGTLIETVWSRNPVWQLVDMLTNDRYGLGKVVALSDIDFAVTQPTAVHCDVVIDGPVAVVSSVQAGNNTIYVVDDTEPFERGMIVEYDGPLHPSEADEIVEILSPTEMQLATGRSDAASGDTITAKLPRWECDLLLGEEKKGPDAAADVLDTFHGFVTYDNGKIQIRSERSGTPITAHFRDFGVAAGYGIIADSFEWLADADFIDRTINRVIIRFQDQDNASQFAAAHDWDHLRDNPVKALERAIDGIDDRDQAFRVARTILRKHRVLQTGARFTVGPIGLQIQPGDRIQVTHTQPNWSAADKRVIKVEEFGLGDTEETLVRLTVVDYIDTIYDDQRPPRPSIPIPPAPIITLSAPNGGATPVVLEWIVGTGERPFGGFNVHRSTSSFGSPPTSSAETIIARGLRESRFVYEPSDDEIGQVLYFIVRGRFNRHRFAYSNELALTIVPGGPLDEVTSLGGNMVWGGDFPLGVWTEQIPTEGPIAAPTNTTASAGFTNAYAPAANVVDGDDATKAVATIQGGGTPQTAGREWWWGGASTTKTGRFRAKIGHQYPWGTTTAWYSTDNRASWVSFGVAGNFQVNEVWSPVLTVDVSLSAFRVTGEVSRAGPEGESEAYEMQFVEQTGALPSAILGNDVATLDSNGTTPAELTRPFPGYDPSSGEVVFVADDQVVTQLQIRRVDGSAQDGSVDVVIRDRTSGIEWVFLSVAGSTIESDWKVFSDIFTAVGDIGGDLEVIVRSDSTDTVQVDKLMIEPGTLLHAWAPHPQEVGRWRDRTSGRVDWAAGDWNEGTPREGTVSGASK